MVSNYQTTGSLDALYGQIMPTQTFSIVFVLIQWPGVKQDEQAGFQLTDRRTQNQAHHTVQLTYWHLTTTALPKQNRENNNEKDAFWLLSLHNPNLSAIKILRLACSQPLTRLQPRMWNSDTSASWCRCLVNSSKLCVKRTLAPSDGSAERDGPIKPTMMQPSEPLNM